MDAPPRLSMLAKPFQSLVERGAGEMKGQQSLVAGLFDNVGVEKAKQAGHAFGGFAGTEPVVDFNRAGREDACAPALFVGLGEKKDFDPKTLACAKAKAAQAQVPDHGAPEA
ncbi:hypothetical protein M2321_001679 [Rhodoblastus acidophilus]|uniref:hypothetical protein n=1 Tax=Rhodoblastus acidophilus TaxID=1074 RepID=UPI0018B07DB0|nr:hypothetical protein [Rhodoblastus acidophilus]MCW2274104.1 hypothetical protein [Rhodoblastus acidophilus]